METTNSNQYISDSTSGLNYYVEFVEGDIRKRNMILELDALPDSRGKKECYRSLYVFDSGLTDYVNFNKSTKEYKGIHKTDYITFDVDCKDSLDDAHVETVKLVQHLQHNWEVSVDYMRFYFSGFKGFHLQIPIEVIGSIEPINDFCIVYRAFIDELTEGFIHVDKSIYNLNRIFRIENTINEKSGLYKIPLTYKQLMTTSSSEIQELACSVQEASFLAPDEIPVVPILSDLFKSLELKRIKINKEKTKPFGRDSNNTASNADLISKAEKASNYLKTIKLGYNEWIKCGFALASLGEEGRELFRNMSINEYWPDSVEEIDRQFDYCLMGYNPDRLKIESLFYIAKKTGFVEAKANIIFWEFERSGECLIIRGKLIEFLVNNGFGKLVTGNAPIFIRIQDNVVKEVPLVNITDFIMDYVRNLADPKFAVIKGEIYETLLRGVNSYLSEKFLQCLPTLNFGFQFDQKDCAYFYYKDYWVKVTKDGILKLEYYELNEYIWEGQVLDRKANFSDSFKESEFSVFIKKVCRDDQKRIESLKSSLGYLLHGFKDTSNSKAIIFCDEKIGDGVSANGRSGKSLVGNALSKFKKSIRLDGRNFTFEKNFAFQQVNLDTQLIEFNDVKPKFKFDRLFSIITDSIVVEKKNKQEFTIPFSKSPKILISTNFSIADEDDSAADRKFEVEFSDYFSLKHKPIDEFGHRFFDDWDEEEWALFDKFMLDCVKLYLEKGLIKYDHINLKEKKLLNSTCADFVDFLPEIKIGVEYNKKALFEGFKNTYPDQNTITQHKFTNYINYYVKLNNLTLTPRKSNKDQFFTIKANTE